MVLLLELSTQKNSQFDCFWQQWPGWYRDGGWQMCCIGTSKQDLEQATAKYIACTEYLEVQYNYRNVS